MLGQSWLLLDILGGIIDLGIIDLIPERPEESLPARSYAEPDEQGNAVFDEIDGVPPEAVDVGDFSKHPTNDMLRN